MTELIKKTLLMGVGLAALTKDKVEELAREVAHSAKLSSEKGQEFVDTVVDRAEKARTDLEARVQRLVQDNLKKAHERLSSRGVLAGPIRDGGDTQFFEIRDVEGNVIEICKEP